MRAGAVVRWALGTPAVLALTDELAAGLAWEALHGAVAKTLARTQARPVVSSRSRANAPSACTVYMCVTSRSQSCKAQRQGALAAACVAWAESPMLCICVTLGECHIMRAGGVIKSARSARRSVRSMGRVPNAIYICVCYVG